jgi:hypothetical protein
MLLELIIQNILIILSVIKLIMNFLEFNSVNNEKRYRYEWNGHTIRFSEIPVTTSNNSNTVLAGVRNSSTTIYIQYDNLKAIFFDLGNTLLNVSATNGVITDIRIFNETEELITVLKNKGFILGIISDGSRNDLSRWLDEPNSELSLLFNKFSPNLIIMSDDDVEGQIRKPHKQIFEKALKSLPSNIKASDSTFLTEDINHFKVYNLVFTQNLKDIESYS